jgi:TonB family protein
MIAAGTAAVRGRVAACADKAPGVKGVVKVHVKVGADGRVASVAVSQTPDQALGSCVAVAVQGATFPKTQTGGSFTYPFVF